MNKEQIGRRNKMVKEIIKDEMFLTMKSVEASKDDLYIVQDLKDTLNYHKKICFGMAANMIGYKKRIIIVRDGNRVIPMINPILIKKEGTPFEADEACLCYPELQTHHAIRYPVITIEYYDEKMNKKRKVCRHILAQIVQHEMDHLEGVLI